MDECSMMFFAGPDSVFGDNEFWGGGGGGRRTG